jgi:hypothetical protein
MRTFCEARVLSKLLQQMALPLTAYPGAKPTMILHALLEVDSRWLSHAHRQLKHVPYIS